MLNPRSVLIAAFWEIAQDIDVDYFDHDEFQINASLSGKIRTVKNLLVHGEGSTDLKNAYHIFQNMDSRILMEGLLLKFSISDVKKYYRVKLDVIKEYADKFFITTDIKSEPGLGIFLSSINQSDFESAYKFHFLCQNNNPETIAYYLNGEQYKPDPMKIYETVLLDTSEMYKAMSKEVNIKSLLSTDNNIQVNKYRVLSDTRKDMIKLLTMYLNNPTAWDEEEDQAKRLHAAIQKVSPDKYVLNIENELERDSIAEQLIALNILPPENIKDGSADNPEATKP